MTFSLGIYFSCNFFPFYWFKSWTKKCKTGKNGSVKLETKRKASERMVMHVWTYIRVYGWVGGYVKSPMWFKKCKAYNLAADSCTLSPSRRRVIAWLNDGHAADICVLSALEWIEKHKVLADFYFAVFWLFNCFRCFCIYSFT